MTTKKTTLKKKAIPKKKVQKFDFSITAVIPTEQYGNVQPSFTVKDVTPDQIEEAREYIHNIFDEYRNVKNVPVVEKETVVEVPKDEDPEPEEVKEIVDKVEEKTKNDGFADDLAPDELAKKSEGFQAAYAALRAAKDKDALKAVIERIKTSKKLTPEEQVALVW